MRMKTVGLISVIIPVFNREKYIKECIDSVLRQKEIEIEIIIIDDGSTDNSLKICKEYEERYSNIIVVHTENKGLSAARNLGISLAKGDYIHFVDSDDFLPNDTLYKDIFSKILNNKVDLIIGRSRFYNENRTTSVGENKCFGVSGVFSENIFNMMVDRNIWSIASSSCNKIINRNYLLDRKLFFKEGILHEDDLWIGYLFNLNPHIFLYDDILYAVRLQKNSIMRSSNSKLMQKKSISKMIISNELSEMIILNKNISKNICARLLANYISFFIEGVKYYYEVDDRRKFLNEVREYKKVLRFSKFTDSRNFRYLYFISKIVPVYILVKIILFRYKVKA